MSKLPSLTIAPAEYQIADVYCGLRDQILRLPVELSATGPGGTVGALMETGYATAVATLVALCDNTTSLYLSNGGGVIGAGQNQPVAVAASKFLKAAAAGTALMEPTTVYPLPRPLHVRFYVLAKSGSWTAEGLEQDLGYNRHALSPLFHLAHAVISEIRKFSQAPATKR